MKTHQSHSLIRLVLLGLIIEQLTHQPVPEMPFVMLSGDTFDPDTFRAHYPEMPANYPEIYWRAQLAAQDGLAMLVPGGIHISHTNNGHNI